MKEKEFEERRRQLANFLLIQGFSPAITRAFGSVKREFFVPEEMQKFAYADDALPIGFGQTISQPSTIARMLELLDAGEEMKVLEVGSGSGYVCALLSEIAGKKGRVYGIEYLKGLAEISKNNLKKQKAKNVEIMQGDGAKGIPGKAPFDRILISAACPFVPKPLFDQLADGGKIVAPVGDKYTQALEIVSKVKGRMLKSHYHEGFFVFVPLRGEFGFK